MPDLERNKQNVLAFYDLMFNQYLPRHVDRAVRVRAIRPAQSRCLPPAYFQK